MRRKIGTRKEQGFPGFETSTQNGQGKKATRVTTQFRAYLHPDWYNMYLYVGLPVDTWDRSNYVEKNRKQHASPGDDAGTAEAARTESGEASKVRHDEQTANRMVYLISSYFNGSFTAQNLV